MAVQDWREERERMRIVVNDSLMHANDVCCLMMNVKRRFQELRQSALLSYTTAVVRCVRDETHV